MKAITRYGLMKLHYAMITVLVSGCRMKRTDFARSKASESRSEEVSVKSAQKDELQGSRVVELQDSSLHSYNIRILPVDTFSFSVPEGFKGKASFIEVRGVHQSRLFRSDSAVYNAQSEWGEHTTFSDQMKQRHSSQSRESEQFGMSWISIGCAILIILSAAWFAIKLKNNENQRG